MDRLVVIPTHRVVKPRCWEQPGHYLCTPEPGRSGCVNSIQIGVKTVKATSTEKRLVRNRSFQLYIFHHQGLKEGYTYALH